jgi:hypothetical protein
VSPKTERAVAVRRVQLVGAPREILRSWKIWKRAKGSVRKAGQIRESERPKPGVVKKKR